MTFARPRLPRSLSCVRARSERAFRRAQAVSCSKLHIHVFMTRPHSRRYQKQNPRCCTTLRIVAQIKFITLHLTGCHPHETKRLYKMYQQRHVVINQNQLPSSQSSFFIQSLLTLLRFVLCLTSSFHLKLQEASVGDSTLFRETSQWFSIETIES